MLINTSHLLNRYPLFICQLLTFPHPSTEMAEQPDPERTVRGLRNIAHAIFQSTNPPFAGQNYAVPLPNQNYATLMQFEAIQHDNLAFQRSMREEMQRVRIEMHDLRTNVNVDLVNFEQRINAQLVLYHSIFLTFG